MNVLAVLLIVFGRHQYYSLNRMAEIYAVHRRRPFYEGLRNGHFTGFEQVFDAEL